ncbi:MAG: MFS transporter [Acetobacteraceae bacterium]
MFARIFLPLSALNFTNQAARATMGLLAPLIALEFGLSASELGLLAATFFAGYALAQLPIGLALDLWGVRRVQTVLALVAAIGFALAALADDPWLLALGRFITGIGVSAGLIAMIKAASQWFARDRIAALSGAGVFIGAFGGVVATVPAQWALPVLGWRGVFWVLAGLALIVAVWLAVAVPAAPKREPRRLSQDLIAFARVFKHPAFLRYAPAICSLSAFGFTYQGLWAGPWLRDAAGLGDDDRALVLLCYAVGLMLGSLLLGQAASGLTSRGRHPMLATLAALGVLALVKIWLILAPASAVWLLMLAWVMVGFCVGGGPPGYAAIGREFGPEMQGRVATAINFSMLCLVFLLQNAIGWVLDLWPRTASGGWDPAAYAWALGLTLALQGSAVAWMVLPRR